MVIYPNTKIDGMFDILYLSNTFSNSLSTINIKCRRDKISIKNKNYQKEPNNLDVSWKCKSTLFWNSLVFTCVEYHLLHNKEKLLSVLEYIDDWDKHETFSIHILCLLSIHISKMLDFMQFPANFIIRYGIHNNTTYSYKK